MLQIIEYLCLIAWIGSAILIPMWFKDSLLMASIFALLFSVTFVMWKNLRKANRTANPTPKDPPSGECGS